MYRSKLKKQRGSFDYLLGAVSGVEEPHIKHGLEWESLSREARKERELGRGILMENLVDLGLLNRGRKIISSIYTGWKDQFGPDAIRELLSGSHTSKEIQDDIRKSNDRRLELALFCISYIN